MGRLARPPSLSPSSQGSSSPTPALSQLAVSGYRSLRQLTVPLGGLTVVCGANGCGKSNLYRALGLIAAVAERAPIWVVAHAEALITALQTGADCRLLRLERELGATVLPGQTVLERAAWRWPA